MVDEGRAGAISSYWWNFKVCSKDFVFPRLKELWTLALEISGLFNDWMCYVKFGLGSKWLFDVMQEIKEVIRDSELPLERTSGNKVSCIFHPPQ